MYTCCYCGIEHGQVEARGIYYCPNPLCTGCGSAWFNSKLKSHVDYGKHYTIDEEEQLVEVKKYVKTVDDEVIRDKIIKCIKKRDSDYVEEIYVTENPLNYEI